MPTTFFTSDMHLGHSNIIQYYTRPFKNVDKMDRALIRNWNARVGTRDMVMHLGDFCFRGGIEGGTTKAEYYENYLNGKIFHVRGSHDDNNGVKAAIDWGIVTMAKHVFMLRHVPPHKAEVPYPGIDAVLCGHVHGNWAHKWVGDIPVINVGVDVRRFLPMTKQEVIAEYERLIRERYEDGRRSPGTDGEAR